MAKKNSFSIAIVGLFLLIFYIDEITCKKGEKLNKNHVQSHESSIDEAMSIVFPNSRIETEPNVKQQINFGKNMVIVHESSEITHENGTVTTKLVLDNGISLNFDVTPKEDNETIYYTVTGSFAISTPDSYTYLLEFGMDLDEFKMIKFERSLNLMSRADARHLAALAG